MRDLAVETSDKTEEMRGTNESPGKPNCKRTPATRLHGKQSTLPICCLNSWPTAVASRND